VIYPQSGRRQLDSTAFLLVLSFPVAWGCSDNNKVAVRGGESASEDTEIMLWDSIVLPFMRRQLTEWQMQNSILAHGVSEMLSCVQTSNYNRLCTVVLCPWGSASSVEFTNK